jgi:hypothetical protein
MTLFAIILSPCVHSEEWSSWFSFDLCVDDHGSPVIFRSASVRPKHLFDLYFDQDS